MTSSTTNMPEIPKETQAILFDKLHISNNELELLKEYVRILIKYNQKLNLISKSTEEIIWDRHILDCAQLIPLIHYKEDHVLDIGSGAGLPGVILSLLGIKNVTLVESIGKKADFLQEVSKISPNKIIIHNKRAESLQNINAEVITSRAVSDIKTLLMNTRNIETKKHLLLKGESFYPEIITAKKTFKFQYTIHPSLTHDKAVVLEIYNILKK